MNTIKMLWKGDPAEDLKPFQPLVHPINIQKAIQSFPCSCFSLIKNTFLTAIFKIWDSLRTKRVLKISRFSSSLHQLITAQHELSYTRLVEASHNDKINWHLLKESYPNKKIHVEFIMWWGSQRTAALPNCPFVLPTSFPTVFGSHSATHDNQEWLKGCDQECAYVWGDTGGLCGVCYKGFGKNTTLRKTLLPT